MKHINFQRGNSMIRTWEQDQKSRVPFNWDRLIYIIILIVVLFFFIRYVYRKTFFIEADGQVLFEKVNIMNVNGKVKRMGKNIGRTAASKKAIVTLTEKSKQIEFFQGL